jgi:predicted adenylyl cyclase CyaB
MYEVEVKAKLRNRKAVIKKLESFGCKFGEELHQIDHIFTPKGTPFPTPLSVPVLRVRQQNDKYFFTLKLAQTGRQDCIEREFEIMDGKKMIEIMELLNYKEVAIVDKKRIKTKYKDMVVELDKVKKLGEFIEIEKIVTHADPEKRKNIQKELSGFLEKLGVAKEDLLVNAKYDIMIFEKNKVK